MFSDYNIQTRQMLIGNLLLIVCCVFYLAWWLIAFKPEGAIKGFKSGWLLIPAVIFGVTAVWQIVRGSNVSGVDVGGEILFPRKYVIIGGIAVYVILLLATAIFMKRQVTTELLLIVGWTVLMLLEFNALHYHGELSKAAAIVFLVIVLLAAIAAMVCYLLYYNLDAVKGYVDGTIPLLLVIVMMAAVTIGVVAS